MPGRPIVSANNSPTERISEFADFFLKPLVLNTKSYVRDTTDFINKIESIDTLPNECYLCTVDVTSLYTNIPNEEGISACKIILDNYRQGPCIPSNDNIILVLRHVLNMNNFNFNGKHYLQVGGTAMGTRVAPSFANIFMADFEERYVYTYPTQPKIWLRYIDDIFMIWDHDKDSLDSFLNYLNECHHRIKFTSEISDSFVNFLDTSVHIDNNRKLYTDLYCKPTDAHNYLLYSSAHPKHLLRSLPYSQLLRIRRICSHISDFDKNAITIGQHFIRRHYPEDLISESIIRARRMDRRSLLSPTPSDNNSDKSDLFVISHFNPDSSALKEIVHSNWSILGRNNTTESIFLKKPIYGYRRTKNLKDQLVHAKIPPSPASKATIEGRKFNRKCKSTTCRYCPRMDKSGSVNNSLNSKVYPTKTEFTCNSNNVIYCLKCTRCNIMYVGQTMRAVKDRFREHFYSIDNPKRSDTTVGRHFSAPDHQGINDVSILILEFIKNSPNSPSAQRLRDEKELLWIHRLSTIAPLGLNSAD
jgi:peptide-methionine (R)-S-oxide reductase